MNRYVALVAFVTSLFFLSAAAEARIWRYKPHGRVRVHVVRPVVIAPVRRTWVPASTVVAPNVIIGPRGRVRYVAPFQPIIYGPYIK